MRHIKAFFLAALFALVSQTALAALAINGTPQTNAGCTTTMTCAITYTTTVPNTIVVIAARCVFSSTPTATGVAGTGLTFAKRKNVQYTVTGGVDEISEWWALASGTLSGVTITVTWNVTCSAARTTAFAISGANTSTPFDTNASLPGSNTGTTGTSVANSAAITTNSANDMLIGYMGGEGGFGTVTRPSGFTQVLATGAVNDLSTNTVSMIQSGQTYTWSFTNSDTVALIVDAVQQAGAAPPTVKPFFKSFP